MCNTISYVKYVCTFTSVLSKVHVQCPIWLFFVVCRSFLVCCSGIIWMILRWFQLPLLLLVSLAFIFHMCWISIVRSLCFRIVVIIVVVVVVYTVKCNIWVWGERLWLWFLFCMLPIPQTFLSVSDVRGTTVPENKSCLLQVNGSVSENGASTYLVYISYW